MDSGSSDRVITLPMIPMMEMLNMDTVTEKEFKQELVHSQHGTIREDLKLSAEPTFVLRIKPTWITTSQLTKSLLPKENMEKPVLEFTTPLLLGILLFPI